MKKVIQLWNKCDYRSVFDILKMKKYNYKIDDFQKDFSKISSMNKYGYLIYLLSKEFSVNNVLLFCDFLTYTDTFFYDIHPVIRMVVNHAIGLYPTDKSILEWVVSAYENHPDSPFEMEEMMSFKQRLLALREP